MIRVATGSRLHFGLFNLGQGPRRFGGVGLMVEEPATVVRVGPARFWSSSGPQAERALEFAQRLSLEPVEIIVERAAPAHAGLGSGTQLALAVGQAMLPDADPAELARRLGRGRRSAVGTHGFARGGFIVEAGKEHDEISPLLGRCDFPADWPIVLIVPRDRPGRHGVAERQAFEQLQAAPAADDLCQLATQVLWPALARRDHEAFGEALFAFNRLVGERFAAVQGGPYADPRLAELVRHIREQGVRGVGQSSWGPTIFAVTAGPAQARALAQTLSGRFGLAAGDILVTAARNRGAGVG